MPAMPFGDMTANFDFARRERIEAEKDRIRSEMSEMEELVTGWEQEAESTKDDIPMVVATRAMEYERNRLLNELEPLHGEVAEALVYLSSPTNSWYRDMSERVRAWITDRRDNPAGSVIEPWRSWTPCPHRARQNPTNLLLSAKHLNWIRN
jgi:hypothetical protein